MSFQHFRLGEVTLQQTIPTIQHTPETNQFLVANNAPTTTTFSANIINAPGQTTSTKAPYGSGDTEDGYTLVFPNLEAFNEWRNKEEENNMVEFVKGDTHGSKAVPPRFKEHTKLLCARHSRSGRKKYVKKYPERVRKVPSRKLEGVGCPASIKYKTYFDSDEVRACYNSNHSHDIGLANLPYTRRGRKAAAEKHEPWNRAPSPVASTLSPSGSAASDATPQPVAGPSTDIQSQNSFASAVSMIAPLPPQNYPNNGTFQYPPTYPFQGNPQAAQLANDRWENMSTLFHTVREHARNIEYPAASVAALESCLIRLFLESPSVPLAPAMPGQNRMTPSVSRPPAQPPGVRHNHSGGHSTDGSGEEDGP